MFTLLAGLAVSVLLAGYFLNKRRRRLGVAFTATCVRAFNLTCDAGTVLSPPLPGKVALIPCRDHAPSKQNPHTNQAARSPATRPDSLSLLSLSPAMEVMMRTLLRQQTYHSTMAPYKVGDVWQKVYGLHVVLSDS